MKEYKIDLSMYDGKVRELVSEAIQRHAFKLGYEWCASGRKVMLTNSSYLFFNADGRITHLGVEDVRCFEGVRYFEDHSGTLISAASFLAPEDAPEEPEFRPFDRVLVRDSDSGVWSAHIYSHRVEYLTFSHRTVGDDGYKHCIPYEGNEHLLGTKGDVE